MSNIKSYNNLNFLYKIIKYINISKKKISKPIAVVFDIDDTLILSKNNQIYTKIKELYDYILKKNIDIFIITARPFTMNNINYTKNQLFSHQIKGYKSLNLMPTSFIQINGGVAVYKLKVRENISKTHKIILNIGDQWSDFYLDFSNIQVPNLFYIINEDNLINIKLINRI